MQRHYFANKGLSSQGYGFSSGHVWTWELDYKENWVPKNLCFWTMVLEKTLESPLDCKEIQPVHPKGNQSWICIERTDAEAETPIFWPYEVKRWLFGKDPDARKEKAGGEGDHRGWDGWMASLTWWTWVWASPGFGDGQGSLVCRSLWGFRVRHDWVTELNWLNVFIPHHCPPNSLKPNVMVFWDGKFRWNHEVGPPTRELVSPIRRGGFPGGSEVKTSACNVGDPGSIPGSRRSPGEGNGNPLQYSCLGNPMDGGAWWATVHGVAKSRTRLSDLTCKKRKRLESSLSHVRVQQEGCHLWARKWLLTRHQICWCYDVGLPSLQSCRHQYLFNHSA